MHVNIMGVTPMNADAQFTFNGVTAIILGTHLQKQPVQRYGIMHVCLALKHVARQNNRLWKTL